MNNDRRVGPWIIPALGVGMIAAIGLAWLQLSRMPDTPAAAPVRVTMTPPPAPAPAPAILPSFDLVRVSPDGAAVLAGRAQPGAAVTVLQNGARLGEVKADLTGAWALIPSGKLPPGATQFTLTAQAPGGDRLDGTAPVTVIVPEAASPAPPMAIVTPDNAPSRLLAAPGPAKAAKLALDTVDYDQAGRIHFSGTAPPGAVVRIYVDTIGIADATSAADGHWSLSPPGTVKPGRHRLRLDQLSAKGQVDARIEAPFEQEGGGQSQLRPGQVVVQPGENLWRLTRRTYGNAMRYTVIYQANKDQIRDPKLIYAGQVFSVPKPP